MLLARGGGLHVLGVDAGLQGDDGAALAPGEGPARRGALLRVLVVEGHGGLALDRLGVEEALVELVRFGSGGEVDHGDLVVQEVDVGGR